MPDLHAPPISILDQIKNNLRDRYDTGYPILKELLQNADDAEAGKFRLDALPGWSTAANPLLRGPGLLVVNDGFFREEDKRGILSFGASGNPKLFSAPSMSGGAPKGLIFGSRIRAEPIRTCSLRLSFEKQPIA